MRAPALCTAVSIATVAALVLAGCPGRDRRDAMDGDATTDDITTFIDVIDALDARDTTLPDVPPPRLPDVTEPDGGGPFFHRVFRAATHNSYWIDRQGRLEPFASGVQERLLDQLLFEHVRALEIDVHRDRAVPHSFRVFHTDSETNSLCSPFSECLAMVRTFHRLVPDHEPLMLVIELKELLEDNFDDTHTPADLDQAFADAFGPALYRPADFLARCRPDASMVDCAREAGWPTTREMRGRVLFSVIANYRVNFTTATCHLLHPMAPCTAAPTDDVQGHGPRGWLEYATWGGGVRERAGFPMRSNWIHFNTAVDDEQAPPEQVTAAENASSIWQVEDLADPRVPDFVEANGLVRGADSFSVADQMARVAAGFQFLQTDHPWLQYDDHGPGQPLRLVRPWPIDPEALLEPGKRIALRGPTDDTQFVFAAATATGATCTRWQTAVSLTRAPTDTQFANAARPHGTGCLRAAASADDSTADSVSLCRTSDDAEYAVISFTSRLAGVDATSTFRAPMQSADGPGEMLRLDVCSDATGTAIDAFSAGAYGIDGAPHWLPIAHAHSGFPLDHQGLAAARDVLFVDARRDGFAISRFDLADPIVPHAPGMTASTGESLTDLSYPTPTASCHDPLYPIGCNAP